MDGFLPFILLLACVVSASRLSELPRLWELLAALAAIPLAACGQSWLAGSNLSAALQTLAGPQALGNWCAMVVMQELLVCIAWSKRLGAKADGRHPSPWTWAAFAPSLLVPVAITAFRLYLFQTLVSKSFTAISVGMAVASPILFIAVAEAFRTMGETRRIWLLLRLELIFVVLGIFMPVAVNATLEEPQIQPVEWKSALGVLAALLGIVGMAAPPCRKFDSWRRFRRLSTIKTLIEKQKA